jgi:hypothetical protein
MADRTLFPHAFGLKTPAPLWTAPAFDRCLLLALIYPVVTIFVIWAISGHFGPAESALGLRADVSGWQKAVSVGSLGFAVVGTWRSFLTRGRRRLIWLFSGVAGVVASSAAATGAITGAVDVAGGAAGVAVGAAFAAANGATTTFLTSAGAGAVAGAAVVAAAAGAAPATAGIVAGASLWLGAKAARHGWQGRFLAAFLAAMFAACFAGAPFLAALKPWEKAGPLLFFLSLLTLLNAPFDWASLGLTRALLRRGLELGGWWPYLLAFLDACLAGVIIVLLALTMVLGVQAFHELAVHGAYATATLPLDTLFDGIAKDPGAPEYWWAYALLLSTMIPSLINLAIGGMAFTRGVPGVSRLLLRWMPEGKDVPDCRRPLALTFQMFSGAALGIAAQALLAWGLLYHLMPAMGLDLLWLCQKLADADLPGKFFHLTGIIR